MNNEILKQNVAVIKDRLRILIEASSSSSGAPGATEATLQLLLTNSQSILAFLGDIDDNLTNTTNVLLTSISNSNVAQEALLTASNTLLTDIRTDLATLNSTGQITNGQLLDVNTELDNIETTLNSIEAANSTFHTDLIAVQNSIEAVLNTISTDIGTSNTLITANGVKLDTLIAQTDQVETLLGNIVTALATNSTVNAAALEQLRLLLVDIDANTDTIETELANIIAEHDQTQVLLTNVTTLLSTTESNNVTRNTAVLSALNDVVTALATNSTANSASLEQLRLLLVSINASTDGIEALLTTIIVEQNDSQVILTSIDTKLTVADENQTITTGTNVDIPAGFKTVLINSISGTNTLDFGGGNTFQLGAGRRADGITLEGNNLNTKNGLLPAITISGGTWQWIVLSTLTI